MSRDQEDTGRMELVERLQQLASRGRETVERLAQKIFQRVAPAEPEERPLTPAPPEHDAPAPIERARSRFASHGLEPFHGELDPAVLAQVDSELAELPLGYGDGRVVLLARDPRWLHAYWDIAEESRAPLRERGGSLVLQLHDVTDREFTGQNSWSMQRIEVGEEARSWYLPLPPLERCYLVEVGYVAGVIT